jgi:hypothetical protein
MITFIDHYFTVIRNHNNLQYPSIYGSTALVDLGPLFQLRNLYRVGRAPWTGGISPSQGHYLHTEQHKQRINAH